ncbi:hypothetical protein C8J56DRAFT_884073 [Mycena floridula]|nr:hypothetical protein C8J56DRAFT_884073 [Mycena floridula]
MPSSRSGSSPLLNTGLSKRNSKIGALQLISFSLWQQVLGQCPAVAMLLNESRLREAGGNQLLFCASTPSLLAALCNIAEMTSLSTGLAGSRRQTDMEYLLMFEVTMAQKQLFWVDITVQIGTNWNLFHIFEFQHGLDINNKNHIWLLEFQGKQLKTLKGTVLSGSWTNLWVEAKPGAGKNESPIECAQNP